MSTYVKSKFRLDYRNFETLPNECVENLRYINGRIHQLEHIEKLKAQIEDLKQSLNAETKFIADNVLKENVFPRFRGYSDFIATADYSCCKEEVLKNPTFGNLATAIETLANDSEIYNMFEFALENFIRIFFEGNGCVLPDDLEKIIIDYESRRNSYGTGYADNCPSYTEYIFNVVNKENGKTFNVSFLFYNLRKAVESYYLRRTAFDNDYLPISERPAFEQVQNANYGQIFCSVREIHKSKSDGVSGDSAKAVYIESFDPLEIAMFIKHVVIDGGYENEQ